LLESEVTVDDFYQLLLLSCGDFPRSSLDAVVLLFKPPGPLVRCGTFATAFELFWFHRNVFAAVDAYYRDHDRSACTFDELPIPSPERNKWRPVVLLNSEKTNGGPLSFRKLCQILLASDDLADAIRFTSHNVTNNANIANANGNGDDATLTTTRTFLQSSQDHTLTTKTPPLQRHHHTLTTTTTTTTLPQSQTTAVEVSEDFDDTESAGTSSSATLTKKKKTTTRDSSLPALSSPVTTTTTAVEDTRNHRTTVKPVVVANLVSSSS